MLEDEKLREEIQEQTGVSSRGYLIPPKKLREEATDMIRHNYERPAWSLKRGKESAKAETTLLPEVWDTLRRSPFLTSSVLHQCRYRLRSLWYLFPI